MSKRWKAIELKVAKSLNTERTPLSGGNSKMTRSDTLDGKLFVEVKHRATFSVVSLYRKTLALARRENKTPVLCLKAKGKHGELAVIDWKLFVKLWKCLDK